MNYKLTIHPAMELGSHIYKVDMFETEGEMLAAKDAIADMLIFLQDQAKIMPDYSNLFFCEELIEGEWVDYEEAAE